MNLDDYDSLLGLRRLRRVVFENLIAIPLLDRQEFMNRASSEL